MRAGVIGGSFNPVHTGHLAVAQEVAELLGLERVYFVVSGNPPHKNDSTLIPASHRYAMVELACKDNPLFFPSGAELERKGPSYTIDTMRHFREELGSGVFFIAGQDAMEDIGSWKSAATLLKTYNFAISTRPGYDSSALIDLLQGVLAVKYVNVRFKPSRISHGGLVETTGIDGASSEIHIVNTTALDISSSLIREKLRTGRSVKYLVPEAVERYLKDNRASLF